MTTHRTSHCLRPTAKIVNEYLKHVSEAAWSKYTKQYLPIVQARFEKDRRPFDKLAAMATARDVFLGCYCPTEKNPHPEHCHTYLALLFMKEKYPDLKIDLRLARNP